MRIVTTFMPCITIRVLLECSIGIPRGLVVAMELTQPQVFVHPDGRLDRKNAAIYIGCSAKTLADWATKGNGPPYLFVGGRVFYFRHDLDAWIRSVPCRSNSSGRTVSAQAERTRAE